MDMTLSSLKPKATAVIKYVEGGMNFQRKVMALGIIPGKSIWIISLHPFRGPLVISVEGVHVAIGRGIADRIIVEVKK